MSSVQSKIGVRDVRMVKGGRAIVDVANLDVAPGETVAIIGPNGAGKSTLLNILGLLANPDTGWVTFDGVPIQKKRRQQFRGRMACVFQSPLLLDRSVLANIELGMKLRKLPFEERKLRAGKWMELLGLSSLSDRGVRGLSGGEAQRVNLARAFALQPEVLFMDEPLEALDAPTRAEMIDELGGLIKSGAGSAVIVTHDRSVAFSLGDRVVVMIDGKIAQCGTPEDVFERPANPEVALFTGVENLIDAEVTASGVMLGKGLTIPYRTDLRGPVTLCLRGEEVRPGVQSERGTSFSAVVREVLPRGDGFVVVLNAGVDLRSRISRAEFNSRPLKKGDEVVLTIRTDAVHLMSG